MSDRPIGIFDSGVGGLTVCKAISDLLPTENIIYFGDTARFPYGTRSKETIVRYSREIANYLVYRNVKKIVIACNTASAAALDTLKSELAIPVVGVVEAGARAACSRQRGNTIGVIGTRATVQSESYIAAIKRINPEAAVLQQQATLFVSLTEEGMTDNEIARLTAKEYINDMYQQGVRTVILGCTHFPMLKNAIHDVYPDLDLVDTGMEIALEVEDILKEKNLENKKNTGINGDIELHASDITDTLRRLKNLFFDNKEIDITKLVING
ncbi:MAG: glutamate racemase [bacterium]|nr:glutamate racemase [bacterium]